MKIVEPSVEILALPANLSKLLEVAGRTCYKSEDKICDGSDVKLIDKLKSFKHWSVMEHGAITVKVVCDRGVSHELVRHRLASFSQESTRYCNYSKGKFGNEIIVISPVFSGELSEKASSIWRTAMLDAEEAYLSLVESGASAQLARSVLPTSLKTEVVITANPREWHHILSLRTHRDAHPQIRQVMVPLGWELAKLYPFLCDEFKDVECEEAAEVMYGVL